LEHRYDVREKTDGRGVRNLGKPVSFTFGGLGGFVVAFRVVPWV
jgi:hypothetical protein